MKRYLAYELGLREKEAQEYDAYRPEYQQIQEWKILRSHLEPKPKDLVLDAGCGTGIFSLDLQRAGCRVVALDFCQAFAEITCRRCNSDNVEVVIGDVTNLPLQNEKFDLVLCSGVLGQLVDEADFRKALTDLARVTKPGGRLVITTYNYHLIDRIRRTKKRLCFDGRINYVRYSQKQLRDLVSRCLGDGFRVETFGILNLRRPPGIWIWNRFPPLRTALLKWDLTLERHGVARLLAYLNLLAIERRGKR